ncbi:DUF3489 domain-containing protein [Oceanibacterium hippocampi]|uniref:DUF3489 domain-containing protein n=1 Tax=Oceanibacterium hippocampi TaxID=745714 RepID=A0A1Y5TVG9_9PROT|nr:DUF3489 domain-containing protein [Oceanibacterium hippocampi]SLN74204.1 hypothetical protein OCH7691_03710 [Oceanibacterium hippocampi]
MTQISTKPESVSTSTQDSATSTAKSTKTTALLKLLRSKRGASLEQLQKASGWQAHSVRGFLSGTVRKKLGHTLVKEAGKDGRKRYRIEGSAAIK